MKRKMHDVRFANRQGELETGNSESEIGFRLKVVHELR